MPKLPIRVAKLWRYITHLRPVVWAGLSIGLIVVVGVVIGLRTQRSVEVVLSDQRAVQVTGPLKVDFTQDIAAGFAAKIEPEVAGSWEQQRTLLGVSSVGFVPKDRFEAGRTYTLRISGLKRSVTGAALPEIVQTFTAQTPPLIKSVAPSAGAKDVSIRPRLTMELSAANHNIRDFKPSLTPAVPLKLVSSDDKSYVWEPEAQLKQGVVYYFAIDDNHIVQADKRRISNVAFKTVTQPGILSARAGSLFSLGQTIDIVFDQPMEQTEANLDFKMDGKGAWKDDHTYQFKPENIKPATTYHYTLNSGLKAKAGGILEGPHGYDLATNGAVSAAVTPTGSGTSLNTPIRVAFDQPVDHASAEKRFSVSPTLNGNFSWSGNTMVYTPSGMAYQTTYTYAVALGVEPAWGLPSNKVLGASFSVAPQTVMLSVPAYKGQHWMSCELSSLRMLLAYRGIKVAQDTDFLAYLGYNPRPRDFTTNTWDDPNVMYVGSVDGRPNKTGYGVHAGPIANAAKQYGRNATAFYNVSAAFIAGNIHAGNPVEFYGHSDPAKADSWNTVNGVVQTLVPQHARVAYGVVGSPENPIGFWIHEPMNGGSFYWTAAQLMANMNVVPGVSNQAVVVY